MSALPDWQPIASAPKDGSKVLLYSANPKARYRMVIGAWMPRFNQWQSVPGAWPMFPTHWAPLPEAPQ